MEPNVDITKSPETCPCGVCLEWRKDVLRICGRLGLNAYKLTRAEKTELRHNFVLLEERHSIHNWKIMEPRFAHARLSMREERE